MQSTNPELAAEFHPTKNGGLTPENLVAGTNKKLWWICKAVSEFPCGHVWQAYGNNRSRKNQGCPACSNHAVHNDGRNSMRATNPELSEEFHPTKNGDLTPDNIIASTGKKLWWRCRECENEWENTGSHRAKRGQSCPACSNKAIHSDGRNSMLRTHSKIAAEFHPSKNNPHTTRSLVAGTNRKLWWVCNQCENEWQAAGATRAEGHGCPSCSRTSVHSDGRNSMRKTHPELAAEFHPTENGDYFPENLLAGTSKKIWWVCKEVSDEPCGHVWKVSGGERLKHGCPPCGQAKARKSQRAPKLGKSLGDLFPEISAEWHEFKNGDKKPTDFNPGTDDKVWWKCDEAEDHVWEATISSRTGPKKAGCPYCRGLKASVTNSITSLMPEIVSEWDTSKNVEVGPSEVVAGSEKKYWWKCSKCEHEWKISPANRKFGSDCPACSNKAIHIDGRNTMRETHPELAAEFDLEKNDPLTPETLVAGTNKSLWWICQSCSHEWLAGGNARVFQNQNCPACNAGALHSDGRNSMRATHPDLAAEFNLEKNSPLTPDTIIPSTHKNLFWICSDCSHEWIATGNNRTRAESGCPACSNQAIHSDGRNSMRATHPDLAAEFDLERNAPLTPDGVIAGTGKRLWWVCQECSNNWPASGNDRSSGKGCPSCSGRSVHTDGRNSMRNTQPHLVAEFDLEKNSPLTPDNLLAGTNRRLWWTCRTCSNEWVAVGGSRSSAGRGYGCPACAGRSLHSDARNSMRNTHPHLVAEFDLEKNSPLTPDDLIAGTNRRLWWTCQECNHKWRTTGSSRSSSETGCPKCAIPGFNISLPGQYYVLEILNEDEDVIFYKGGISNDYKRRLRQHKKLFSEHERAKKWTVRVLEVVGNEDGAETRELERLLLRDKSIRAPHVKGASSELFITNPLEYAREKGWVKW